MNHGGKRFGRVVCIVDAAVEEHTAFNGEGIVLIRRPAVKSLWHTTESPENR